MAKSSPAILIIVALAIIIAAMCAYTVDQREKALVFRLGEIVETDISPGLHFKLPIINNVRKFDARVQTLDSRPERFLTSEKKNVIVDTYVKWRISNVKTFYTAVGGDILQVDTRLNQMVKDLIRAEFSKQTIRELVSRGRDEISNILVDDTNKLGMGLGIEIVDIRIKRIDLPSEVSSSVFQRMESERARVARDFRSRGAEAAERIRADADKQREVLLANAYKESETLRGTGDAVAAERYAKAYQGDAEFFSFYRSLSAYRKTFNKSGDLIVLEPNSDFFEYFGKQGK